MAVVRKPVARVSYTVQDETGSIGSSEFNLPADVEEALTEGAAGGLRDLIQNMTDCSVLGFSITKTWVDTTPETPSAGSRVERKGTFQFTTAAGKVAKVSIPGIDNLLVNPDGTIDASAAAVAAFTAALTEGTSLFRDSNNVDLVKLTAAYERYNSSTKGQLPNKRLE